MRPRIIYDMDKIKIIQLRAQAVVLAKEGYSHKCIAQKLNRSKCWVTKWVGRSKFDEKLVDMKRSGRPKILSNTAKRLIQSAKYRRGQSLRRISNQLKLRNERASKDTIRRYMVNDLKWKNWRTMTLASFNRMVQDVIHQPKQQDGWKTTFHRTLSRRTGHRTLQTFLLSRICGVFCRLVSTAIQSPRMLCS